MTMLATSGAQWQQDKSAALEPVEVFLALVSAGPPKEYKLTDDRTLKAAGLVPDGNEDGWVIDDDPDPIFEARLFLIGKRVIIDAPPVSLPEPGVLYSIVVTPTPVELSSGDTQAFTATGYDYYGDEVAITPTWSVETAVRALTSIVVSPDPISLDENDVQAFTAVGYDQFGDVFAFTPTWSSDVGTITSGGVLTAQATPGVGTVTASSGAVADSAAVTVTPATITDTFYSEAADGGVTGSNSVWLTARAGSGLSASSGTGTAEGVASTELAGAYPVQQAFLVFDTSSIPDTATITEVTLYIDRAGTAIAGIAKARVHDWGTTVTTADFVPGADLTSKPLFASIAIPITAGVYTAMDSDAAAPSLINKTGKTRLVIHGAEQESTSAPAAGTGTTFNVVSSEGTNKPKLVVSYYDEGVTRVLTSIVVSPDPASVEVSDTQLFTAIGYDQFSDVIAFTPVWSTDIGSINSSTGLLTAPGTTGTGTVTATSGAIEGEADVTVTPVTITDTFFTEAADGYVYGSSGTWLTARAGSGLIASAAITAAGCASQEASGVYYVQQAFLVFDTSSIPDTAVITAATLHIDRAGTVAAGTAKARAHTWGPTLATSDFVAGADLTTKTLFASIATGSVALGSYTAMTSDGGAPALVNKTGKTRLVLHGAEQESSSAPAGGTGTAINVVTNEGTNKAKLVVSYYVP